MNIVFVSREYPPSQRMGGIASYIKEIAESLAKKGHQITVVCASDDTRKQSDTIINGIRIIRLDGGDFIIPDQKKTAVPLKKLRTIYRFYSYRKKIRYTILSMGQIDIIEVAEYGAEGYYLSDLNIPVVARLHTPTLLDRETFGIKPLKFSLLYEYWVGKQELKILRKARYITSCSKSLVSWFDTLMPEISSRIKVIYNPLNLSRWDNTLEVTYRENTILYVGTVAKEKGVEDLIDACKILNDKNSSVTLTIVGKLGTYALDLKTKCENAGYTWCKFIGHIERSDLKEFYSRSKISCFPSWWEAFGIVCIEAMSIGNIVIGSNKGGMAEIIHDGEDGFLVSPKNPLLLAEKIEFALSLSQNEVDTLKSHARSQITQQFSTEVIIKQMESYYSSIISEYNESPLG